MPYIEHVSLNSAPELVANAHPGNLAFTSELYREFASPITFFVGENGAGKSTLLEAMAVLSRLPICGGGTNEYGHNHAFAEHSILAESIRLAFVRQPRDRYFFRADTAAHFASLLGQRDVDPEFVLDGGTKADPFVRYGGESLHQKSHGESFLALMQNRFQSGLFFFGRTRIGIVAKKSNIPDGASQRHGSMRRHSDIYCDSFADFVDDAKLGDYLLRLPGTAADRVRRYVSLQSYSTNPCRSKKILEHFGRTEHRRIA